MGVLTLQEPDSSGKTLSTTDLKNQLKQAVIWLAPLALVYVTQLQGVLQTRNFGVHDLVPTQVSLGAMELYVVNQLYGLFNKWKSGS